MNPARSNKTISATQGPTRANCGLVVTGNDIEFVLQPTLPQAQRTHEALAAHPAFALAETFETLLRPWHIAGPSVRPAHRMVAHTGFLTLARRVQRRDEAGPRAVADESPEADEPDPA